MGGGAWVWVPWVHIGSLGCAFSLVNCLSKQNGAVGRCLSLCPEKAPISWILKKNSVTQDWQSLAWLVYFCPQGLKKFLVEARIGHSRCKNCWEALTVSPQRPSVLFRTLVSILNWSPCSRKPPCLVSYRTFGLGWVQRWPLGVISKPGGSIRPACPDGGFVAMPELWRTAKGSVS